MFGAGEQDQLETDAQGRIPLRPFSLAEQRYGSAAESGRHTWVLFGEAERLQG
jgi:hypothetical protein